MDVHQANEDHYGINHGSRSSTTTRSYDCVFCQRGFTTAQALGGHMNIHRKDRATTTAATKTSGANKHHATSKQVVLEEEDNNSHDHHHQLRIFYPSKSCISSNNLLGNTSSTNFEGRFNQFGSNSSSRKTVQDYDHGEEEEEEEGEELDLELRLGHYPW